MKTFVINLNHTDPNSVKGKMFFSGIKRLRKKVHQDTEFLVATLLLQSDPECGDQYSVQMSQKNSEQVTLLCSLIELHQIIQEKITEGAFEKIFLYIEANLGKPASPYVSELTRKNISYIYNQSVYLALFTETDALIHTAGVQLLNHSYIADDVLATHQFVSHLSDQLNPMDARANEIRSEELTVSNNKVSNLAHSSNRYTRYLFCFFSSSSAEVKPTTSDSILTDKSSVSMVID